MFGAYLYWVSVSIFAEGLGILYGGRSHLLGLIVAYGSDTFGQVHRVLDQQSSMDCIRTIT